MRRFPAELTIRLVDGAEITEVFNQAEMAYATREWMLDMLGRGEILRAFDGEERLIEPRSVESVRVKIEETTYLADVAAGLTS
ncbi:MAG: hypothetical protein M1314_02215 [Firmicutes bacterium]|nr:hypothetical protein [Bacillota bacterium]